MLGQSSKHGFPVLKVATRSPTFCLATSIQVVGYPLHFRGRWARSHSTTTTNIRVGRRYDNQNTGQREDDEVVQLNIRDVSASVTRPVKELKGFQRIALKPGEKRRVEFVLGPEHLGFYNRELRFVVEPGEFKIMVGANSQDVIETSLIVK